MCLRRVIIEFSHSPEHECHSSLFIARPVVKPLYWCIGYAWCPQASVVVHGSPTEATEVHGAMWAGRRAAAVRQQRQQGGSSSSARKRSRVGNIEFAAEQQDMMLPSGPQTAKELFEWQESTWNKLVDPAVPGFEDLCRDTHAPPPPFSEKDPKS